jgi:cephalosporin-C deacetylase
MRPSSMLARVHLSGCSKLSSPGRCRSATRGAHGWRREPGLQPLVRSPRSQRHAPGGQTVRNCSSIQAAIHLDAAQLVRVVMGFAVVVRAGSAVSAHRRVARCRSPAPRSSRESGGRHRCIHSYVTNSVWEMDCGMDAYEELRLFFRSFDPRHEQAIGDLHEAWVRRLPARCAARAGGGADVHRAHGHGVSAELAVRRAYNKLPGKKSLVVYPDFAHEPLPGQIDRPFAFMGGL